MLNQQPLKAMHLPSKELNTLNNFRYWRSTGKYFFISQDHSGRFAFCFTADVSSLPPSQSQKISSIQKQSTSPYEAPSSDSDSELLALIIGLSAGGVAFIAIVVWIFYILIFVLVLNCNLQTFLNKNLNQIYMYKIEVNRVVIQNFHQFYIFTILFLPP